MGVRDVFSLGQLEDVLLAVHDAQRAVAVPAAHVLCAGMQRDERMRGHAERAMHSELLGHARCEGNTAAQCTPQQARQQRAYAGMQPAVRVDRLVRLRLHRIQPHESD